MGHCKLGRNIGFTSNVSHELLRKLNLSEAEREGVVLGKADQGNLPEVKWMAVAKLLTIKGFSEVSLDKTMRAAWNTTRKVTFRPIGKNLFVIQPSALGIGMASWMKVHHIPHLYRTEEILKQLAAKVSMQQMNYSLASGCWLLRSHGIRVPRVFVKGMVRRGMVIVGGEALQRIMVAVLLDVAVDVQVAVVEGQVDVRLCGERRRARMQIMARERDRRARLVWGMMVMA
ncbi:hypothetical protein QYE76_034156 [Lolium multiflorum]|uniref:Uncharacterized protein n=1 Tax=Lolium multiflorum TaxID=4521 RepID=A0AAD8R0H8_LOLMU|nr:hypothetical protein QYE76_034156 [Lolium multiflorum]